MREQDMLADDYHSVQEYYGQLRRGVRASAGLPNLQHDTSAR